MRSKAASRAALAELRANRASGRSRLDNFEIDEDGPLYDEVDDEAYKNLVRKRLDDDDFVVDDNGAGYADDGREEWDDERYHYAVSDSEGDARKGGNSGLYTHSILQCSLTPSRQKKTRRRSREKGEDQQWHQ
jgi:DNA polymerase alpha subunit A